MQRFLCEDERDPSSDNDFGKNIIPKMIAAGKKMQAYDFSGYWKDVGTVQSLWEANMDLLEAPPKLDLHDKDWRIYSKSPIMPPQYVSPSANIKNSMVTEGCVVQGSVTRSVLFAGVTVEEGATIADSVIMPGSVVKKDALVFKAIVGENAVIGEKSFIGAQKLPSDGNYDTSLTGDITLIASDTELEAQSRIPVGMIVNADAGKEGPKC